MKNVKIKVETDEQNLKVQKRLCELNEGFAWFVYLNDSYDYRNNQGNGNDRAVCSRIKQYKYLVVDVALDLIICTSEDIWKKRKEKEVSFEDFMKNRMKSIKETHPSLCKDLMKNITKDWMMIENFPIDKIQKHTVDKSVLKEILEKDRPTPFYGDQASSEVYGGIVEDIYQLLEG